MVFQNVGKTGSRDIIFCQINLDIYSAFFTENKQTNKQRGGVSDTESASQYMSTSLIKLLVYTFSDGEVTQSIKGQWHNKD